MHGRDAAEGAELDHVAEALPGALWPCALPCGRATSFWATFENAPIALNVALPAREHKGGDCVASRWVWGRAPGCCN